MMKAKIIFTALVIVGTVAIASAVPDQPFMRAARADLQTAKSELQKAMPDKGGHRVKAIALVNKSIAEVNAGIAWDRRHNHANAGDLFAAVPDQPHMQAALAALESAKNNLDHASADKGGHRGNALDLIKAAIDEVKQGIESAR